MYTGLVDAGVDPSQFEAAQELVTSGAVSGDGEVKDPAAIAQQDLVIKLGIAGMRTGMQEKQRVADDHLAVCFVQEWSYDVKISADAMLDIPSKARALIVAACKPLADGMTPDFGPNQDEGSPTTPSSG